MTTSDTGVIAPLSQPIVDLSSGLPTKPMADFMFFVNKMAGTTDPTTQEKIDTILDRFNSNEGSIQQLVEDLLELSKGLGNQISELRETVSEDKVSLARKITAITAALNDHAAAIMTAETSRASDQEAIATVQQSLNAQFGEAQANIAKEETARASADSALSQLISALSSTLNGQTTTLSEIAQSIDGIEGRWGVQIDANRRVTGIQLIGTGDSSQFIIDADVLVNGSLTATKIATSAVETEKIAPNAVTVSLSATGSTFAQTASYGFGETTNVTAFCYGKWNFSNDLYESARIKLYRDGVNIKTWDIPRSPVPGTQEYDFDYVGVVASPMHLDTVNAGVHYYSAIAEGTAAVECGILILGTKR